MTRSMLAAVLIVLTSIWGWTVARTGAARRAPVTRAALMASFERDLRDVVLEWSAGDRRPLEERRRALFDFVYQTYDSSAWIPQSLFDGSLMTQAIVGDVDSIVRDQVGLTLWRGNPSVPAFGMAPSPAADEPLKWTVNCLACHTAEIDGVAYFGAGAKTFDDKWLGDALKTLTSERWRPLLVRSAVDAAYAADAHRILNAHHHDKVDSLTRGRSTAFAASHVELYMRPHEGRMPAVEDVGRGDTKTPPLWHTAAKMQAGRWYADGSFHGEFPLMASSMELEKDRSFDALVDTVIPAITREFVSVVQHLRPPTYPYAIDRELAERGRQIFYSREAGCARCHGDYDGRGNVRWPGVHVDVGTDRGRLEVVSDKFVAAFDDSPIAAYGALVKSQGYAATPLTGVWSNYPYLHNGSVPTLHHLLGPVDERPEIFDVHAARQFDRRRVGQQLFADPAHGALEPSRLLLMFGQNRDWFNTSRPGSGNRGHDVWSKIKTDANRLALIEYLKTL